MHKATAEHITYDEWLESHKPFNWIAEFYDIIHGNGGFDVIIGNPPYVSMSKISYINKSGTFKCSDLYAYVIRRVFELLSPKGKHGFIVMHNLAFSRNFKDLRRLFRTLKGNIWWSFYSRIPSGLFSGDVRVRNSIYIYSEGETKNFVTRLHRWFTEQRGTLFQNILYSAVPVIDEIPMLDNPVLLEILKPQIGQDIALLKSANGHSLYIKSVAYNSLGITPTMPPSQDENGNFIQAPGINIETFKSDKFKILSVLFLGKIYFAKWLVFGDDFHFTSSDLFDFKYPFDELSKVEIQTIESVFDKILCRLLLYFNINSTLKLM